MIVDSKSVLTLEEIYNKDNNSFDLLRFVFSTIVIYSHSFAIFYGPNTFDTLLKWTNGQLAFGSLAVDGFFILSGFLITQSLLHSSSYKAYFLKRLLRIIPAFFASLFIISFFLGPLFTSLLLKDYFSYSNSFGETPWGFFFKNITFNIFGYSWTVRDLFASNPYASSANGSMWTLKHELAMYFLIPLLSYFLFFKIRQLFLLLGFFLLMLNFLNVKFGFVLFKLNKDFFWVLSEVEYSSFIRLAFFFIAGSIIYLWKDKIYFDNRLLGLSFLILVGTSYLGFLNYALMIFLPYLILGIGISKRFSSFGKYGDFSYGLYIYAFPIQQTLILIYKQNLNFIMFVFLSFVCTLIVSVFSWRYIERPSILLKRKLR